MQNKKNVGEPWVEDIWEYMDNKYEAIIEMCKEGKRLFEISEDKETKISLQAINSFFKKQEENSSRDNK